MASLTHVCMWGNKTWEPITAEEAARIHPSGTVSAQSGLFMCERCGQYVLLTNIGYQVRHFRHSSAEKSKDCPDRVSGAGGYVAFLPGEHELPIKIQNISGTDFELTLGFISIPSKPHIKNLQVTVKPSAQGSLPYVYSGERFNTGVITYLSIGSIPSDKYIISISGVSDNELREITFYWPKTVQGIDYKGTLFDSRTGKKLVYDSDVEVRKNYYLLKRGYCFSNPHVSVKEICRKYISQEVWYVYEVMAKDYDEKSARFFLDYHCRLTENPASIQVVWPVYLENPYLTKHNTDRVIIHIKGNIPSIRVFPETKNIKYLCDNGSVQELFCNSHQQMISVGRTKVLKYKYFWKQSLNKITSLPIADVVDLHGNKVNTGENKTLPDKNILRVTVPFDGTLILKINGVIIDKRKLKSRLLSEIDNISWNMEVSVMVGLDCVWRASFIKEKVYNGSDTDDIIFLHRLCSYSGRQIKLQHTAGNIAVLLKDYPKVKLWLYQCIRTGKINEKAYRELQLWAIDKQNRG